MSSKGLTDQVNQRPRHRGAARRAAGAHHRDRRLRRAQRLRPRHRGGVRGSQGEGRGHRQGAGGGARRDLRLQHLDPADHVARRERQGPGEVHRHPLLLAGRAHDAGRDHHGQEDRRRGAGDGARFRARDPQDADRGQRLARLLHLARGRHLYARRPSDADRRRAGGDDRECRPHGRHAGRAAVAQRRGRGRSRLEDRQGDRGRSRRRRRSIRGRRRCSRTWSRSSGRLGRKNGKGFYDYPEKGPKKLWPGLAELQPTKLDPDTIDVQELKHRLLAMQALETARCFEEGVLTDVREADVGSILGFGFAPFSGGTLSYIDMMGAQALRRAVPAAGEEIRRRALRRRSSCSTWRRRAKASMAASRPARRRHDHAIFANAVCCGRR